MLVFELNLSQRDGVVTLLNQLNQLILSDDQPAEKRNECNVAINRLTAMLKDLEPVQEDRSSGPFDRTTDGPQAKKTKTDAVDRIVFEIKLDDLQSVIGQITKNQMVAIRYPNLVKEKTKLARENSSVIEKIQQLPMKTRSDQMDGAAGGGLSGGSREPSERPSGSGSDDDRPAIDARSTNGSQSDKTDHPASGSTGDRRSNGRHRLADTPPEMIDLTSSDLEDAQPANEVNALRSEVDTLKQRLERIQTALNPTNTQPNVIFLTAPDDRTMTGIVKSFQPSSSNHPATAQPKESAPNNPNASEDADNPTRSASTSAPVPSTSNAEPPNGSNPIVLPLTYCLEGVENFFATRQERSTDEFWLSKGSNVLKFNYEIGVTEFLNGRKFLMVTLRCHIENGSVDVRAKIVLLSQVADQANKQRDFSAKFSKEKPVFKLPCVICHDDLKESPFLSNDRLRIEFDCRICWVHSV